MFFFVTFAAALRTVQIRRLALRKDIFELPHPSSSSSSSSSSTNNNSSNSNSSNSNNYDDDTYADYVSTVIRNHVRLSFATTTIVFGVTVVAFALQCLTVQTMRHCGDESLVDADFAIVWVATGLVGGAAIGSAALCWVNALGCVMGARDAVLPWWGFLIAEGYLLLSPFILAVWVLMGIGKGAMACVGFFGGVGRNGETRGDVGEEGKLGDLEGGTPSRAEMELGSDEVEKGSVLGEDENARAGGREVRSDLTQRSYVV